MYVRHFYEEYILLDIDKNISNDLELINNGEERKYIKDKSNEILDSNSLKMTNIIDIIEKAYIQKSENKSVVWIPYFMILSTIRQI